MFKKIKICGLNSQDSVDAAIFGGASYLGFVFCTQSPRFVMPQHAFDLTQNIPVGQSCVALICDATDDEISAIFDIFSPDFIQLHGHETPERTANIRQKFMRPIIKAVGVSTIQDIKDSLAYHAHADMMLYDAKPKPSAVVLGGHGMSFDWNLLKPLKSYQKPYFVAGGLHAGNIHTALEQSGADYADLSSGVETTKGVKSPEKITALLNIL